MKIKFILAILLSIITFQAHADYYPVQNCELKGFSGIGTTYKEAQQVVVSLNAYTGRYDLVGRYNTLVDAIEGLKTMVANGKCVYTGARICEVTGKYNDLRVHIHFKDEVKVDPIVNSNNLKFYDMMVLKFSLLDPEPTFDDALKVLRLLKESKLCSVKAPQEIQVRETAFGESAAVFIDGNQASDLFPVSEAQEKYNKLVELIGYKSK